MVVGIISIKYGGFRVLIPITSNATEATQELAYFASRESRQAAKNPKP